MSFKTTKFHEILLSGLRERGLLTDRQVKNIISFETRCVVWCGGGGVGGGVGWWVGWGLY